MRGVDPLLTWLDSEPARQHALTWVVFLITCALALVSLRRAGAKRGIWEHPVWFILVVVVALCACRWPIWFAPDELNPDESQMLAGAITLQNYPIYWKHVDGTTHGPLTDYFLLALSWLGLPLNYATARAGGTLLQAVMLLCVWGAARRFCSEGIARSAILPGVAFWSFTHWTDYTHYSSELVPATLIALALYWLIAAFSSEDWKGAPTQWRAALAGIALGAVPFAKLQLTLLGLALGLGALGYCWRFRHRAGATRAAINCALGALAVPSVFAVLLCIYGLIPQFRIAYILSSLSYVEAKPTGITDMVSDFFSLISHGHTFVWFIIPAWVYVLWHGRRAFDGARGELRSLLWLAWLLAVVGFLSVITPGRMLAHYLQILVVPTTLLLALHLASAEEHSRRERRTITAAIAVFLAMTVVPQLWRHYTGYNIYLGNYAANRAEALPPESRFIIEHARPGDRLAMWGWHAQIYVETALPQGTREAHTAFQLLDGPLRDFYRDRYLRDITRWRPAWFVDSVRPGAFGFSDRGKDGHESFPQLADFIAANYRLLAEIEGHRIYRLLDSP